MEALILKRKILRGRITRIENVEIAHREQPLTSTALKLYVQKLEGLSNEIDTWQCEIIQAGPEESYEEYETAYNQMVERVEKLSIAFVGSLGQQTGSNEEQTGSTRRAATEVRLPKLELPTFGGEYEKWLPFKDLFTATVHSNSTLSGAQRLQYLRASLKDEALRLVQSIPLTDGNYAEAWQILTDRFDNRREITEAHVKRLFEQRPITNGSAVELRRVVSSTKECIQTLKVLEQPVEHWGTILLHIVKGKLDAESVKQWELSLSGKNMPEFSKLMEFLEQRARALAAASIDATQDNVPSSEKKYPTRSTRVSMSHHSGAQSSCNFCGNMHVVQKCPLFLKATPAERKEMVKRSNLCYNCLRADHRVFNCVSSSCRKCNHKHHTLIHFDNDVGARQPKNKESEREVTSCAAEHQSGNGQVILSTAIVWLKDTFGKLKPFRALLDSASQSSFITQRCVQVLGLRTRKSTTGVTGIGFGSAVACKGKTGFTVYAELTSSSGLQVEALILSSITKQLPSYNCDTRSWKHLEGLQLADPTFHQRGPVDLLLGADVYMDIILDGQRKGPTGTPGAFKTVFGWCVMGPSACADIRNDSVRAFHCSLDEQLRKFWELEEINQGKESWTEEEKMCEKSFIETHTRDETGRYTVRLPFKEPRLELGDTRGIAVRRFLNLEKKMIRDPIMAMTYKEFMSEYSELGHMELVENDQGNSTDKVTCYLPHHAVIKEASSTTKLRVVFDASVESSNGTSLNDALMVGPKLQEDLLGILVRFRFPMIAMVADLAKMYRQIWMHPDDRDYQRIVWRDHPSDGLQEYRLRTLTYGTAPASFLATRVLRQLSKDARQDFPLSARIFDEDFYMDDLLTGEDDKEEAIQLKAELMHIASQGGFELRKWASNEPALMDDREQAPNDPYYLKSDQYVKTLGLLWLPSQDNFSFSVDYSNYEFGITKRLILSDIARVFDPLGLLAPVTIKAKIMMQDLWRLNVGWDEPLDSFFQERWLEYTSDLQVLKELQVPRCVRPNSGGQISLHGFCDSSERAYAAVVYLKTCSNKGGCSVRLLAAKTRVAPVKITTIPRLELCGAVLLTRLLNIVRKAMKPSTPEVFAWTDSTIVLAWLDSEPRRWKTFVSHRVAEIQESIPRNRWRHVEGSRNPADCASRGIRATELKDHPLWWSGPSGGIEDDVSEQEPVITVPIECKQERVVAVSIVSGTNDDWLLTRYASLSKLKRITAYIKRFVDNCKTKDKTTRRSGMITASEINAAELFWVQVEQKKSFPVQLDLLRRGLALSCGDRVLQLNPFIDQDNILRVGGRIKKAGLTWDRTHPILLSRNSRFTEMLIDHEHLRLLHAGPQLVMTGLQERFWIIRARDAIRFRLKKCVICARQRAETVQQVMADLPKQRVQPGRPFIRCGVDYAGPFILRVIKGRGHRMYKGYVAVFVCFATRAMHLELVSDLSAEAFVATLKRFVSRRGRPSEIHSDNGTNFVGAAKELKELVRLVETETKRGSIYNWLLEENITWYFNPPTAPHFGGLWEAGVRSVKYHLKRTMGDIRFTYEEMSTLLCQVEACLNSRPLTSFSTDPTDLTVLTPGHFLIGEPLVAIPEPNLVNIPMNRLGRWQVAQRVLQDFWRRWQTEYLSRLQQRPKWLSKRSNLQVGDMVLLKDDDVPPTKWRLGRVHQVHAGQDGCVRVVTVKTACGLMKRPVVKLCLLPLDSTKTD